MRFEAEVRQIKSMVDGSCNVTFNLPEYQLAEAQLLMGMIGDMVQVDCRLLAAASGSGEREAETEDVYSERL